MIEEDKQKDIVQKYANCMQELKYRIDAINAVQCGQNTTLYKQTNIEFIALQLRKIMELIALANLVANKDEYEKIRKSFATDWNAERIIKTIKKINPEFFPKGIYKKPYKDSKHIIKWVEKTENILTESTFKEVLDKTSDILHAQNPFDVNSKDYDAYNIKYQYYFNLIINLLAKHQVKLCNEDIINCTLFAMQSNGENVVNVMYCPKIEDDEKSEILNKYS